MSAKPTVLLQMLAKLNGQTMRTVSVFQLARFNSSRWSS